MFKVTIQSKILIKIYPAKKKSVIHITCRRDQKHVFTDLKY
jgi:hypothetical protein